MWKIITPLLVCLNVLSGFQHSLASEISWEPFQKFAYFSPENRESHQLLNSMLTGFRQIGIPEQLQEEMARDFYSRLESRDTLRPYVNNDWVLLGINTRWVSTDPDSRNPLLKCPAEKPTQCQVLATFPNREVVDPIFYSNGTLIIERETFEPDVFNTGTKDFLISRDDGKIWQSIETPIPCKKIGYWCELRFQDAERFVLLSTHLKKDNSGFDTLVVHTSHDAGKSWGQPPQRWYGVDAPSKVALHASTLMASPSKQETTVSFLKLELGTHKKSMFTTDISSVRWATRDTLLHAHRDHFLGMLNKEPEMSSDYSLFRIATDGTKTAQIWNSNGHRVQDLLVSDKAIVIRTWNQDAMVPSVGKFREFLHFSLDSGSSWVSQDIPHEMLGGLIKLSGTSVWIFLPSGIQTLNLGTSH